LAKTYKGKGFVNIEDAEKWHGTPLNDNAVKVLEVNINLTVFFSCFKNNRIKPL
jgi:transketolase